MIEYKAEPEADNSRFSISEYRDGKFVSAYAVSMTDQRFAEFMAEVLTEKSN